MCAALVPTTVMIAFVAPELSFIAHSLLNGVLAMMFSYCFCLAITLFFGCPTYLFLQRFTRNTLWSYAASGLILSATLLAFPYYQDSSLAFFVYGALMLSPLTAVSFWFFNRPDLARPENDKTDLDTPKSIFFVFMSMLVIGMLGFIALASFTIGGHWLVNKDKCLSEGATWNPEIKTCEYD